MITKNLLFQTSFRLGKNELANLKTRAMRRGVWFRVLTLGERAQIELTMRIVKRIRSFFLARVVTSIVEKLLEAMESKVTRLMREVGPALGQSCDFYCREAFGSYGEQSYASDERSWTGPRPKVE